MPILEEPPEHVRDPELGRISWAWAYAGLMLALPIAVNVLNDHRMAEAFGHGGDRHFLPLDVLQRDSLSFAVGAVILALIFTTNRRRPAAMPGHPLGRLTKGQADRLVLRVGHVLLVFSVMTLFVGVVASLLPRAGRPWVWPALEASLLAAVLFLYWIPLKEGPTGFWDLGIRRLDLSLAGLGVLFAIPVWLCAHLPDHLLYSGHSSGPMEGSANFSWHLHLPGLPSVFSLAVVTLVWEFVYRGTLLPALAAATRSATLAVFLAALIGALDTTRYWTIPGQCLMGIASGYLCYKTASIVPSVALAIMVGLFNQVLT